MLEKEERCLRFINNMNNLNFIELLDGLSQAEFIGLSMMQSYMDTHHIDKMNVNKIAEINHVSVPAISRLLRNLECRGLIKRNVDLLNRRNTNVMMTEKGKELLEKNWMIASSVLDEAFGSLEESQKEVILNSFEALYQNLNKAVEKKKGEIAHA